MKKSYYPLSWRMSILLVISISIGFWQAAGRAEEQSAGETSGRHQSPSVKPEGMSEMFKGTVVEVIDAGRHIYVHIDTGQQRVWVAVPSFDGKIGDKVLVPPGVPVADFQSKTLNRKFKMIYFVGGIRRVHKSTPD
ncbi:MAG: TOBE domain-containing protein [Desulfobacterales bacterium]